MASGNYRDAKLEYLGKKYKFTRLGNLSKIGTNRAHHVLHVMRIYRRQSKRHINLLLQMQLKNSMKILSQKFVKVVRIFKGFHDPRLLICRPSSERRDST